MIYNFLKNFNYDGVIKYELIKSNPNLIYLIKNNRKFYIVKFFDNYNKVLNEVRIINLFNSKKINGLKLYKNIQNKYITPFTHGRILYGIVLEYLFEQGNKDFFDEENASDIINHYFTFLEVLNEHKNILNVDELIQYNQDNLIESPLSKIKKFCHIKKFEKKLNEIEKRLLNYKYIDNSDFCQIIHGDLHKGNILFGKSITFIDFEDIGIGSPLLDISSAMIEGNNKDFKYQECIINESINYFGSVKIEQELYYYNAINYLIALSRGEESIPDSVISEYLLLIEDNLLKGES